MRHFRPGESVRQNIRCDVSIIIRGSWWNNEKKGGEFQLHILFDFTIQGELKGHCISITFSKLLTAWELGTGVYSNLVWKWRCTMLIHTGHSKTCMKKPSLGPWPPLSPFRSPFSSLPMNPVPPLCESFLLTTLTLPFDDPDPPFRPWPPPLFLCHPVFVCFLATD